MLYINYIIIYNKINNLFHIFKVNYNIDSLYEAAVNKPVKWPLTEHILAIGISSNNGANNA